MQVQANKQNFLTFKVKKTCAPVESHAALGYPKPEIKPGILLGERQSTKLYPYLAYLSSSSRGKEKSIKLLQHVSIRFCLFAYFNSSSSHQPHVTSKGNRVHAYNNKLIKKSNSFFWGCGWLHKNSVCIVDENQDARQGDKVNTIVSFRTLQSLFVLNSCFSRFPFLSTVSTSVSGSKLHKIRTTLLSNVKHYNPLLHQHNRTSFP